MTSSYQGAPVVVLGASGFIGQWVVRKLMDAGADVFRVARSAAPEQRASSRIIKADLTNPEELESVYRAAHPSIVFNLAGYGVDSAERDESLTWRINADLPRALCECASRWTDPSWRGAQIVHAGSAAEYGAAGGNLREDGPAMPLTLYGKSKLEGTARLAAGCAELGLRGVTARLFTVYGPGEHPGRLLPSLLEASRTGRTLDLSAGLQRRDFTYVEDAADGLLRLGLTAGGSAIVNLATGRLTTVRGFVETAAAILEMPASRINFGALPQHPHDMEHDHVSLDFLRRLVGWIPPTSIKEGIHETLASRAGRAAAES